MNINDANIVLDELAGYSKNGGYKPLQDRLMKKVEHAKSLERLDYLRKDADMGIRQLQQLIKNMKIVQNGETSRYLNSISVNKIKRDFKNGNSPELVQKHIDFIKNTYKPAISTRRKDLVANGVKPIDPNSIAGKARSAAKSYAKWNGDVASKVVTAKMKVERDIKRKFSKNEGCEVGMNNPMGFVPEVIDEGFSFKIDRKGKKPFVIKLGKTPGEKLQQEMLDKIKNAKTDKDIKELENDYDLEIQYLNDILKVNKALATGRECDKPTDLWVKKNPIDEYEINNFLSWLKTTYKTALKNQAKLVSKKSLTESVAPRNIFYRMTESEMFMTANRMAKINGQEVVDILPRVAVEGQGFAHVGMNDLDSTVVYELFESNRFKLSCKQQMKKLLAGGDVVLVYGDEYRIPTCIPFVIQSKGRNAATVFVNITPFTSINKNGKIVVTQIRNYSGLMAVIFAGCVAYETIRGGGSLPADLADALVLFYAGMMTKVINGLVHADSIQKETCKYLCAEFALVQMYGTEKGTMIFQRFKNKYFPKLGNLVVNSIDDTFHIDSFDNMTLFVEELKKNYPIMKGLSVPAISERWMRSFGSATALSLDYLGFHLYTLCMLLFESPLVSRMALEPLIDQKLGSNAFKRMQIMIEG